MDKKEENNNILKTNLQKCNRALIIIPIIFYMIVVFITYIFFSAYFNKYILLCIFTTILGIYSIKYKAYLFKFNQNKFDSIIFSLCGYFMFFIIGLYEIFIYNTNYIEPVYFIAVGFISFGINLLVFKKIDNAYNMSLKNKFQKFEEAFDNIQEMKNMDKFKKKTIFLRGSLIFFILMAICIFNTNLKQIDSIWTYYGGFILLYFYIAVKYIYK